MSKKRFSESLISGIILALAGGFLDAYTYLVRGKTFASMQTGNLILFGMKIAQGNPSEACMYLIPIASFLIGIIFAVILRHMFPKANRVRYMQAVLALEVCLILAAGFIPCEYNFVANMMLSLAMAMQYEAFKTIQGVSLTTTMCTGNLKSVGENLSEGMLHKDKERLINVLKYLAIIASFVIGVILCTVVHNNFDESLHIYIVNFVNACLVIVFILLFFDRDENDLKENA